MEHREKEKQDDRREIWPALPTLSKSMTKNWLKRRNSAHNWRPPVACKDQNLLGDFGLSHEDHARLDTSGIPEQKFP